MGEPSERRGSYGGEADAKAGAKAHRRIPSKMKSLPAPERLKELLPRLGLAEDGQLAHLQTLFPKGGNKAMQALMNLMQSGVVDCLSWQRDSSVPESICAATGKDGDRLDLIEPIPMPPVAGCTMWDTELSVVAICNQLRDSMAQVTANAIKSEEPLVELASKFPLQVCLVAQRIRLTKLLPRAKREGRGVKSVETELNTIRDELRSALRGGESENEATLQALLTLLHEQLALIKSMVALKGDDEQTKLWRESAQFLFDPEGGVKMRLSGEEIQIGNEYCAGQQMVTTDFTHLLRSAYVNTMVQEPEKRVLVVCGNAGGGKERLLRDIGRLLGTLPTAIRGFETTPNDKEYWDRVIKAAAVSSGGPMAPFIVSQADRLPAETLTHIINAAMTHDVALCLTMVPGSQADSLKAGLLSKYTFVMMPEAPLKVVAEGLLQSQGLKNDTLAGELADLLQKLDAACSKQEHYDFGPRTLSQLCGQIGDEVSKSSFADEKQIASYVVQRCVLPKLLPADAEILQSMMKELFEFELKLSEAATSAAKRFGKVTDDIRSITKLEPDCMVLPVPPEDEEAFFAEFCKGLNADGERMIQLEGRLCDLSVEDLLGTMPKKGEAVKDGLLVTTLREAMSEPNDEERKVWIVMRTGDITMAKWECLFELLNDSGCLNLVTGEQLRLAEYLRYMFVMPGVGNTVKNTFGRSALIWTNP